MNSPALRGIACFAILLAANPARAAPEVGAIPAATGLVVHGKAGQELALDLSRADEVPREWKGVSYFLTGITKDGQPIPNLGALRLSNTTGRLQWTPEPAQAGRYELLFVATPDSNTVLALRRTLDIEVPAITTDSSPLGRQLAGWWKERTAAGLVGDAYDNRDGGHSVFNTALFPQLTTVTYPDEYKQRGLDKGAQVGLLFNHTTVGNCSMAGPVDAGGCLVRTLLTDRRTAAVLAAQYRRNHLYVYPEHLDHDPGHNGDGGGYGDLLPANTPYTVLSQGSSGSDQPFIQAWFWALASFRPEVQRVLAEQGLLMPTLQALFRMSNKNVTKPEDYFTGKAHPTAFDGANVDAAKMAAAAHALRLDSLPPLVQLRVVEEDHCREGRDFFDTGADEELANTASVIARLFRGRSAVRRLVVSAEDSYAVNGRIEAFQWVVLRGDPQRIRITSRNAEGSLVEIQVGWQPRRPIAPGATLESSRVDIGVFARTARAWSAPAFVCVFTFDNEARTYESDGRLVDIGYDAGDATLRPADVADWPALAGLVLDEKPGALAAALQRLWSAAELAALREAAGEIRAAAAGAAEGKDKKVAEARQAARPKLGGAFEARLVAALNRLTDDPNFVAQNAAALAALPEGPERDGFAREQRRAAAMGVARSQDGGLTWTPARGSLEKLTAYERNCIAWVNLAVLRALAPGIVTRAYKANYVDQRFTSPRAWRDVLRYDAAGRLLGWMRYRPEGPQEFTADGYFITETDKLGRAAAARKVAYAARKNEAGTQVTEAIAGPVVRYQYASDQDLVGRPVP